MLNIDTTTMLIELTRGDTANIVFSAVDKNGNQWNPTETTDTIKFAVAKKVGATPLVEVVNTFEGVEYTLVEITEEEFDEDKTKYYTESGGVYTPCTEEDVYDPAESYYVQDYSNFWTITIGDGDFWVANNTEKFKFADYVWDLQLTTSTGVDTIIGQTDDISPTFRVLGEVATE